jgi:hypothetical protein
MSSEKNHNVFYLYKETTLIICKISNESRGRVVNSPASYSGGSGFISRLTDRLNWLRLFVFFSAPTGKCLNSTLNSPFTYHPPIRRYTVWATDKNTLQINK